MALKLEFCNVIVPVKVIQEKLGVEVFKSRFSQITDLNWHDGHLFREGCMNEWDLNEMLDEWENEGLELQAVIAGVKHWQDLCVVNSRSGPSLPCGWIEYDPARNIVWLKGRGPGIAVGPPGRKVSGEE